MRLREAAQHDRAVAQVGVRSGGEVLEAVVGEAEVRLVGDEQRFGVRDGGRDRVEVVPAEDVTGRVDGRVDDRERRLGADCRRVLVPIVGDRARTARRFDHLREEERRRVADGARAVDLRDEVERLHAADRDQHAVRARLVQRGDRLAQRRRTERGRVCRPFGCARGGLDHVGRHVDRGMPADREQVVVALGERARGHPAHASRRRSSETYTFAARSSSGSSTYSTSACAPEPTGPW